MRNVTKINENAISGAIKVDEKEIQDHLSSLVRQLGEDPLNELLNAEADASCGASRYQRLSERQALHRSGITTSLRCVHGSI